jgi:CRISPR-associated protein Cas1
VAAWQAVVDRHAILRTSLVWEGLSRPLQRVHREGVMEVSEHDWRTADMANRCLSAATACLYGVTEAAVLAAGYSPAIGFLHTGKTLSFVYDIADLVKFEIVVPIAFRVAASKTDNPERDVRHACRNEFKKQRTLGRLIPMIDHVLSAGGIQPPPRIREGQLSPALPEQVQEP